MTSRAGRIRVHKSVHDPLLLAGAVADRTGLDIRLILCTLSPAIRAALVPLDGDLLLHPGGNLLQCEIYPREDVTSLDHPSLAAPLTASETSEAFETAEAPESTAKEVAKDIIDIEVTETSESCTASISAKARLAETVISGLLVRVTQY